MNIAQLLHGEKSIQSISHYPVFTINSCSKYWYFYSARNCTLRKKVQNTRITAFINSEGQGENEQGNGDNQERGMILEVREVDHRQPKNRELYEIKVTKLAISQIISKTTTNATNEQSLMQCNSWRPSNSYQQISLYKINTNEGIIPIFYTLLYSSNLVSCSAPITSHLRNKLTQYCDLIATKVQSKWLKCQKMAVKVNQFQLVFTYDQKQGKAKIVFAHNFIIRCLSNQNDGSDSAHHEIQSVLDMYATNFKVANDEHQRLQLFEREEQNKIKSRPQPIIFSDVQAINQSEQQKKNMVAMVNFQNHQQNNNNTFCYKQEKSRLKMIKFLSKFHQPIDQQYKNLQVAIKKQLSSSTAQHRQFQCAACYCCVKPSEFETQRMITSNRLKQVQMLRQIKMNLGKAAALGQYEMVPVCQLCYKKYLDIVADNKQGINENYNRKRSNLNKTDIGDSAGIPIKNNENQLDINQSKQRRAIAISTDKMGLGQNIVPCTIKQQVRPSSSSAHQSIPFYVNPPRTNSNVSKSRAISFMSKNRQTTKDTIAQLDNTINREEPMIVELQNQKQNRTRCASKSTKNPSLFPSYNSMKARAARKSINAQQHQQQKSTKIEKFFKSEKVQSVIADKIIRNSTKQVKKSEDNQLETQDDIEIALQEYDNWHNIDSIRKHKLAHKDRKAGKYKIGYFC